MSIAALSLAFLIGTTGISNAQGNRNDQKRQQKIEKKERKDQQKLAKREDKQIKTDQRRDEKRIRDVPVRKNNPENNRYRVNRNGDYYETNNRGIELLKHAVNAGYQEGYGQEETTVMIAALRITAILRFTEKEITAITTT